MPAKRARLGSLAMTATSDHVSRDSLDLLARIFDAGRWPKIPVASYDKHLVDPAVLELALARGIPLAIPKADATAYRFWLMPWAAREFDGLVEDQLVLLGAHAWLGAVLVASMLPGPDRKRLGPTLDRAARIASTHAAPRGSSKRASSRSATRAKARGAAGGMARVFAAIDAHAAQVAAFGTLDVFVPPKDSSDPAPGEIWLQAIARPSVMALCPRVATAIREITPARLLRNTLHAKRLAPGATDDDARTLVELATASVREPDTVMSYGNMQAVLVAPATTPAAATPALEAAIAALLGPTSTPHKPESSSTRALAKKSAASTALAKTSATNKTSATKTSANKTSARKRAAKHASAPPIAPEKRVSDVASAAASIAPAIERLHGRLVMAEMTAATRSTSTDDLPTTAAARSASTDDLPTTAAARSASTDDLPTTAAARSASTDAAPTSHATRSAATDVVRAIVRAHDEDFPSLAHLLDHAMPWWTLDLGTEMPQQMADAARYLFGGTETALATPAPSAFPWELLIMRIGEIMYRALAPATSKVRRDEFVEMLTLWLASGFPARTRALRGADFMVPAAMVRGMDRRFTTRLVTWGANRYFVRYFQPLPGGRAGVRVVEYARDGVFRVPEGVQLGEYVPAETRFDARAIERTLELLATRGPVPYDPRIAELVAQRTGLSPAAATLVWTAGYEPWLLGEKKRAEFGLERDALDAAERELAKPRLREIYVGAMPADPASLYEPPLLAERVADAWRAYRAEVQAREARRAAEQATTPLSETDAN
ncbi:MAG: hypothetical protein AB7T06_30045 [Kofleriaceae bacterium]